MTQFIFNEILTCSERQTQEEIKLTKCQKKLNILVPNLEFKQQILVEDRIKLNQYKEFQVSQQDLQLLKVLQREPKLLNKQ